MTTRTTNTPMAADGPGRAALPVLLGLLLLVSGACRSSAPGPPLPRIDVHDEDGGTLVSLVDWSLERAEEHAEQGRAAEAGKLVYAAGCVDPEHPALLRLIEEQDVEPWFPDAIYGSNVTDRAPVERSTLARVLLWLPDRIRDLFDVITVRAELGPGLGFNLHLTGAAQVGAGWRSAVGLGLGDQRALVSQRNGWDVGLVVPGLGVYGEDVDQAGLGLDRAYDFRDLGSGFRQPRPDEPVFLLARDFWGLGASANLVLVGARVEVHPVQIVDLFGGIIGDDLARDDSATTRPLALSGPERVAISQLVQIGRDQRLVARYRQAAGPR